MDSDDSVIFCQTDFRSSSFTAFGDMREKDELVDFKIIIGNRSFMGHRLILAAAIPYFRMIFSNSEEVITLKEMDADTFESIINFAYSGKLKITSENVQSLLLTSEVLQLRQIQDACWEFLGKRLSLNNVWEIRALAADHLCPNLVFTADHFIRQNFEAFSVSDSFLALPFSYLRETISRDDVKVATEEYVFEAVLRWVKVALSERKDQLPELLAEVRMSQLTPDYLTERVSNEELVRTSFPCRDLVDEAKLYHWLPEKRSKIRSFTVRPRIYEGTSLHLTLEDTSNYGIYVVCSFEFVISVKLLDSENEKWVNISTCKSEVKALYAVPFNETFYIFSHKRIATFNVKTLKWHQLETVHQDISYSSMALHNNLIYFFGGPGGYLASSVRCFDPQQNNWITKAKMTRSLQSAAATSLLDYIFITGGCTGYICKTVERYKPENKEWSEISSMLAGRCCHGCTSLNGKIYVCGGYDFICNRVLNTAEVYDPLTNLWSGISHMNSPRSQTKLVPWNGKLYALDGKQFSSPGRGMEIYDPKHNEWKLCAATSEKHGCQMCLISTKVIPIC